MRAEPAEATRGAETSCPLGRELRDEFEQLLARIAVECPVGEVDNAKYFLRTQIDDLDRRVTGACEVEEDVVEWVMRRSRENEGGVLLGLIENPKWTKSSRSQWADWCLSLDLNGAEAHEGQVREWKTTVVFYRIKGHNYGRPRLYARETRGCCERCRIFGAILSGR